MNSLAARAGQFRGALPTARLEFAQALLSVRSLMFGGLFLALMALVGTFGGVVATQPVLLFVGPLVALLSTVDTVVGERQARTLDQLLAKPVTRRGLALGKFLGRGAHLGLLALVGIVAGGLLSRVGLDPVALVGFAALAVLLFLVYAALSLALSCLARTPSAALAMGAGLWFLFDFAWLGVTVGLQRLGVAGLGTLLNPNSLYLGAAQSLLPGGGLLAALSGGIDPAQALVALLAYLALALGVAVEVFHRQEELGV